MMMIIDAFLMLSIALFIMSEPSFKTAPDTDEKSDELEEEVSEKDSTVNFCNSPF